MPDLAPDFMHVNQGGASENIPLQTVIVDQDEDLFESHGDAAGYSYDPQFQSKMRYIDSILSEDLILASSRTHTSLHDASGK